MITIENETFQIRKIRKVDGKWQCFPKEKNAQPIELDADIVYGKLPPVRKFLWQYHELHIKRADSFIISAEMDGLVLFDIPENQYPDDIKRELKRTEEFMQKAEQCRLAYDAKVKSEISNYLPMVKPVCDMEKEISKLLIVFRPYLKIHFYKGEKSEDAKQRLTLMYWLMVIADRLYKRHVRKGFFDAAQGVLYFMVQRIDGTVDYNEAMVNSLVENPKYRDGQPYVLYHEITEQLHEVLPNLTNKTVEVYCNYVVREVLYLAAQDVFEMHDEEAYHSRYYSAKRVENPNGIDEEIYMGRRYNMKLPQFVSFIIEKKFSSEEIEMLHNRYNLL